MMIPNESGENGASLPNGTKRALGFVNCVATSLTPEKRAMWNKDIQVALIGFILGVRPAVLMDFPLDNPDVVQTYLDAEGRNTFIHRNEMIVDRDAVQRRIDSDPEFAKTLGWQEGMSIDEWLSHANPGGNGQERGIIGFFLGFPKSAVAAYSNKQIGTAKGVNIPGPYGGRVLYFTTDEKLAEADDVNDLRQKSRAAFENAGLGRFFRS